MKKILLIIAVLLCIFQMVVLAVDIDVGSEAIDRPTNYSSGKTIVDRNNPANETGTITSIEIYATLAMSGVEVAIFYVVSGNNLSTRSNVNIGDVAKGYNQFDVSLTINSGDCIGIHWTGGNLDLDNTTVCTGCWYQAGDYIPCTDILFQAFANRTISLYGTGTTAVGWDHKWNTQTISKWNTKEFTKWNDLE